MADKKKKSKSRRDEDSDKPNAEECAVAKHLRFGLAAKEARLVGMTVKYFVSSEAIDKLLESKWATNKNKQDNLFTSRQSCVNYLDRLLNKGMFHRASRAEKRKKEDKVKKKDGELEESQDDKKLRRRKKDKKEPEEKDKGSEKEETEKEEKKEKEEKSEDKKKKEKKEKEKKVKLRMHDDQIFVDGEQVYVWIYDPVNVKTFIIGLLMVLGTIGLCLFPLWPPIVRLGVYYCSLGGAVFVGFILALAVVRFILFCLIWLFSGGKHHFWFLPNLTEDVGFFDSFKPLYTHLYKGADSKNKKAEKAEKTEKTEKPETPEKTETVEKAEKEKKSDEEKSESSDNDGYEMVDKSEVTDQD